MSILLICKNKTFSKKFCFSNICIKKNIWNTFDLRKLERSSKKNTYNLNSAIGIWTDFFWDLDLFYKLQTYLIKNKNNNFRQEKVLNTVRGGIFPGRFRISNKDWSDNKNKITIYWHYKISKQCSTALKHYIIFNQEVFRQRSLFNVRNVSSQNDQTPLGKS